MGFEHGERGEPTRGGDLGSLAVAAVPGDGSHAKVPLDDGDAFGRGPHRGIVAGRVASEATAVARASLGHLVKLGLEVVGFGGSGGVAGRDADAGLEGHAKLEGVRVCAEGVDVFGLAEEVPAAGGAHLRARGAARAVREVGIVHVVDEAEVIARLGEGHAEVPPLEERAGDADGSVVSRVGDRDGRVVRRGRRAKRKTRARISVRRMRSEGSASARDRRTRRERRPHRAARAIESTVEASPSGFSSARANCTTTCT